jgi:hypothetical protein
MDHMTKNNLGVTGMKVFSLGIRAVNEHIMDGWSLFSSKLLLFDKNYFQ